MDSSDLRQVTVAHRRARTIKCGCTRWSGTPPCQRAATQEDFLCDACRDGCASWQISSQPQRGHIEIVA